MIHVSGQVRFFWSPDAIVSPVGNFVNNSKSAVVARRNYKLNGIFEYAVTVCKEVNFFMTISYKYSKLKSEGRSISRE